jgi:hypothetical protein
MSSFTYEYTYDRNKLVTFEWDNVWIEHAEKDDITRILYIGDSISVGTRHIATRLSMQKAYFDNFGTSKAVDNPYFCDSLSLFAAQEGYRNAVIFNNGLHGWHLDDEKEYPEHYEKTVRFLIDAFKGTPVFLVLTTHVADKERDNRVKKRNCAVKAIAQKYGLPIIDFYTPSSEKPELLSGDGVHFTEEGYNVLASTAIQALLSVIEAK